jgi:hypothetical protein
MILYHGTNIDTDNLSTPLWVTPDYHLAGHFALHAKSNTIKTIFGYIYKLDVDDNYLEKVDNRRYLLNGGNIVIIEKTKVTFDKLTGFKKS